MAFDKESAAEAGKKSTRKGKPNAHTSEIRQHFQTLLEENLETLQDDLNNMDPVQRVKVILDMAKFVLPTLRATELSASEKSQGGVVTFRLPDNGRGDRVIDEK